jgi:ATP-dependent Clp protease ATP-binding subunit ClpA
MTTNAGARDLLQGNIGFSRPAIAAEESELRAVKDMFSPEFRNRLDGIITFRPLTRETVLKVVDKFIQEVATKLLARNIHLDCSDDVRDWLAEKGYDVAYGARPLARVIQDKIKKPLSDELLFGKLSKSGGRIRVQLGKDGHLIFDVTSQQTA